MVIEVTMLILVKVIYKHFRQFFRFLKIGNWVFPGILRVKEFRIDIFYEIWNS